MILQAGHSIPGPNESELKLVRSLGRGNFGQVFLAEAESGDSPVAVKTLDAAFEDGVEVRALTNEMRLAAGIKHPNVIHFLFVHDGVTEPELPPYIVMEYAPDGTLRELLDDYQARNERLSVDSARSLCEALCDGMDAINKELLHRDIKPANILLRDGVPKISDFGLARLVESSTRIMTFKGIQDIRYIPPESWEDGANTIQMDIYSMGIVFFEIWTGSHPFEVDSEKNPMTAWRNAHLFQAPRKASQMRADTPQEWSDLIEAMLSKNADDRPGNWTEVRARFRDPSERASESPIDPKRILQKVLSRRTAERTERERELAEAQRRADRCNAVQAASKKLLDEVEAAVAMLNQADSDLSLSVERRSLSCTVSGREGSVVIKLHVMNSEPPDVPKSGHLLVLGAIEGKAIGWGMIYAGEEGFNLLLIQQPKQIECSVNVFSHMHNPLSRRGSVGESIIIDNEDGIRSRVAKLASLDIVESTLTPYHIGVLEPLILRVA